MKRRQLMGYAGAGLLTAMGGEWLTHLQANAQTGNSLSIQWLGHSCFLFTGGGLRVLVNPFRPGGCTAKYRPIRVTADLVLVSSQLLDEGYIGDLPGNPKLIFRPGVYEFGGIQFQGVALPHDRRGGRQFGMNNAWSWRQAGVRISHLGVPAGPISIEQKTLFGRPDVALIPVGGGAKGYNAQEAQQAIQSLNPRLIIPTYYRTQAADDTCDIAPLDEFLNVMQGTQIVRSNTDTITIRPNQLPETSAIQVMSYRF